MVMRYLPVREDLYRRIEELSEELGVPLTRVVRIALDLLDRVIEVSNGSLKGDKGDIRIEAFFDEIFGSSDTVVEKTHEIKKKLTQNVIDSLSSFISEQLQKDTIRRVGILREEALYIHSVLYRIYLNLGLKDEKYELNYVKPWHVRKPKRDHVRSILRLCEVLKQKFG